MSKGNDKTKQLPPEIQRVLDMAALKARLSQATQQSQTVVNTLVKYSEALGRMLQCARTVVDIFGEVEEKFGECPDEGLRAQVLELRKVVYDILPKPVEVENGEEEPEAAGEGQPDGESDGGVDAAPPGEEQEGGPADDGAQDPEAPTPEADAPPGAER